MSEKNLKYYECVTWCALSLGGRIEDYQLDEDNKVYHRGEIIGEWKTKIISTKDKLEVKNSFLPCKPVNYIEISFNIHE